MQRKALVVWVMLAGLLLSGCEENFMVVKTTKILNFSSNTTTSDSTLISDGWDNSTGLTTAANANVSGVLYVHNISFYNASGTLRGTIYASPSSSSRLYMDSAFYLSGAFVGDGDIVSTGSGDNLWLGTSTESAAITGNTWIGANGTGRFGDLTIRNNATANYFFGNLNASYVVNEPWTAQINQLSDRLNAISVVNGTNGFDNAETNELKDSSEYYSHTCVDFLYNNLNAWNPFYGEAAASGTTATISGDTEHLGVLQWGCAVGQTKSGYGAITGLVPLLLEGNETFTAVIKPLVQTANQSVSPHWVVTYAGYQDGSYGNPEPVDGVFFRQVNNTLTPVISNNSVQQTGTPYTITMGNFYKVYGKVLNLTAAEFKIYNSTNGNTALLYAVNLSGRIPYLPGREVGIGIRTATNGTCQAAQGLIQTDLFCYDLHRRLAR